MKLEVSIFADRTREGTATVTLDSGATKTFRCLARSDVSAAAAHGNPTCDPLKPFGHLPTGSYDAAKTVPEATTAANLRAYGPGVRYVLNPKSGDALQAKANGRYGLLIHGGATGAPMPKNRLRPTHGCLRIDDESIRWLDAKAPANFRVTVKTIA